MTENEKKLLQAQHRLEEAHARDRERKSRNYRLLQEVAILEATMPHTKDMTLEEVREYLYRISHP